MECPNPECRANLPSHVRHCIVCGADAKVPNLRAASQDEEVRALELRVTEAEKEARTHGYDAVLNDFHNAASKSFAVICRPLGKVNDLLSSDNQLFGTFYQSISSDTRLPEDNEWDRIRQAADSLLFPFYYHEIRFAALSIDGSGVTGYGEYCIVLNDVAIKQRATVFEENTIVFVQRHRIVAGDPIPFGYRATWENRGLLAVAKLSSRLTPSTTPADYQSILINSSATDSDFIEVHIYGPIHRRSVKHVSGPEPRRKADKVVFNSMLRKLREIGATWEKRP